MSILVIKHRRPVVGRLNNVIGSFCGLLDELVSIVTFGSVDVDLKLRWMFSETATRWDCS